MEYRIKAAARMIMELTREEAFELGRAVDDVQKRFHIGDRVFPFDKMPKEDVAAHIEYILKDETLVIPAHLKGYLERFLELMINERAPMDELSYEYSRAFGVLLHYDLLKRDAEDEGGSREMNNIPRPDRPDTTKIYEHYGAAEDYECIKSGEYAAVDYKIFREEDLKEATADMVGFGTAKSQRIIIDYDRDYGWFMVKRILMDHGDEDTPGK